MGLAAILLSNGHKSIQQQWMSDRIVISYVQVPTAIIPRTLYSIYGPAP